VFHQRHNATAPEGRVWIGLAGDNTFQPNIELVFTKALLNNYLANVTISALTLNTWKENMSVNATEFRNTYRFSEPLNLILPYSLSLAITLFFVGIRTWSLLQNGVSAADGGFLQIMKSTTDRTEMEDLVVKDNAESSFASKRLLELKIRYGELNDAEGVGTGRAAFGMEGETRPLWNG
jgi:hypothetical protein